VGCVFSTVLEEMSCKPVQLPDGRTVTVNPSEHMHRQNVGCGAGLSGVVYIDCDNGNFKSAGSCGRGCFSDLTDGVKHEAISHGEEFLIQCDVGRLAVSCVDGATSIIDHSCSGPQDTRTKMACSDFFLGSNEKIVDGKYSCDRDRRDPKEVHMDKTCSSHQCSRDGDMDNCCYVTAWARARLPVIIIGILVALLCGGLLVFVCGIFLLHRRRNRTRW